MTEDRLPFTETIPILDMALRMLEEALPDRGRLLDLPCGTGYLSVRAAEQGWDVHPYDLMPEVWEGGDGLQVCKADMNALLPIETDRFDAVVCCEGIEHIENPWLVLREFFRVVRPGGAVIISLPNTIDVRQRFRLLRLGFFTHYLPSVPEHINFLGTFGLCHALLRVGFDIRRIGSPKNYGGVVLRTLARFFKYGKRSRLPEHVRAMLSAPEVLCARTVVISARTVK
jgi:SAM-dependent methyltransferase